MPSTAGKFTQSAVCDNTYAPSYILYMLSKTKCSNKELQVTFAQY